MYGPHGIKGLIHWPLCQGAPRRRVLGNRLPFSSHRSKSVAIQQPSVPKLLVAGLQSLVIMLQGTRIPRGLAAPPAQLWIRYTIKNPSISKPVSKATKSRSKTHMASKKRHKSNRTSMENDFCHNIILKCFPSENQVFGALASKLRLNNREKK